MDLAELTGQNLCAMMDQCVAQAAHPEAQAAAVRNLQAMEQKNVEVARPPAEGLTGPPVGGIYENYGL